jgi:hypothetical protein
MTYSPSKINLTYTGVASTAAAVAAVAMLLRQQGQGQGQGNGSFPPELMQLLSAMAVNLDTLTSDMEGINSWLAHYQNSPGGAGYPPNTNQVNIYSINLTVAGQPVQLQDMIIPDDFYLVVKSAPGNPGAGLVYIGNSQSNAANPLSSYPLIPNEFRAFRINQAKTLWVSATIVPALVIVSAEQKQ